MHLQHGPIDLIIGAEGDAPGVTQAAFARAEERFSTVLDGLVADLPRHRSPLNEPYDLPHDPVARRMYQAAGPYCQDHFVTPMIAVAGSVADTVLDAMRAEPGLVRAYVNNGGDIALHLTGAAQFSVAMAGATGTDLGRVSVSAQSGIGGIATSGWAGRSYSLGIADSVTVLARNAAQADAAATLIANAVDLPDHPGIVRMPAQTLSPDSDLGDRRVVTDVPQLSAEACDAALARALPRATDFLRQDLIQGAALFLQGRTKMIGHPLTIPSPKEAIAHV